jgi:hypothetical protein
VIRRYAPLNSVNSSAVLILAYAQHLDYALTKALPIASFSVLKRLVDAGASVSRELVESVANVRTRVLLMASHLDAQRAATARSTSIRAPHDTPPGAETAARQLQTILSIPTRDRELLRERGRWFYHDASQRLPVDTGSGVDQKGFLNALEAESGTLWAGYRILDMVPMPLEHAWNIVDNTVLDRTPTAKTMSGWYYGVRVPYDVARELVYLDTAAHEHFLDALRFVDDAAATTFIERIRVVNPIAGAVRPR